MANSVSITAHCADVISYARFQNGMRAVNRAVIKNTSEGLLTNLILKIESDPDVIYPTTIHVGDIKPGGSVTIDDIRADLSTAYLAELTEQQTGVLRLTVSAEDHDIEPVTFSHDITILPYDQWEGVRLTDELLASFCVPNHPDVKVIVSEATKILKKWTGDGAMNGYHSGDIERVKLQTAAIFEVLKGKGISYAMPPASFYESGQRIRMPEEIFSTRLATCMDSTMLFASCLECVELHPIVIITKTHAYVGVWLDDETTSPGAINDDPALLRKRNAEGINQLLPVETTCIDCNENFSFDEAVQKAEKTLGFINAFECSVDIHEARKLGVNPLPLRVSTPEGYKILPPDSATGAKRPESLPTTDDIDLTVPPVVDKQTIWERKLLDLSLRNNLINIHPRYILQMMDPDSQGLVSALENGRSMRIGARPDDWMGSMHSNGVYYAIPKVDKMSAFADAEALDGKVHTFLDDDATSARIDTLRETARRSIDENGANSLYLTVGTLKWIDSDHKRKHFAPIILIPCEIIRQSGSIAATGEEPVVNLTLLEMLRENYGISIPGLEDLPQKDGHTDVRRVLNTIRKAVMEQKGWDVDPMVFLGNFTFSKFIIWNDIHTGQKVFDENPLVASFKNGELDKRIEALPDDIDNIDAACPPQKILLPIGADSSQMKAIRDAIDGRSFVMQGPPGTGKSQTITNIIANALYHGKRVLFVSEKKAALEVVQNRLESIGLGPFCLELHSNKARKSLVLDKIERTLELETSDGQSTFASDAQAVEQMRSTLDSHVSALHKKSRSAMTLYDALSRYLSADKDTPCRNMPECVMSSLSPDTIRQMQAAVRDYAAAASHVSIDEIRELLDLPLKEYTPAFAQSLNAEMERLLATGNPLLFRFRSRKLSGMFGGELWNTLSLRKVSDRRDKVNRWHGSIDALRDYAIYNSKRTPMRALGLGLLASDYEKGGIDPSQMQNFLMKSIYGSFAKDRIAQDSHLSMFCGDLFENTISDYREAEKTFSQGSREEICRKMYGIIEDIDDYVSSSELTILKKAIRNGARGMSLRTLFSKIPSVLPTVCPCMLMSPLSVSQYLSAEAGMFDIVIFDEASQLQTCEAVGSIGRGKSLIVAGDPKQLPPTTFFETLSFDEDNAEREDMESVLEDCISLSVPSNTLRWHYRSHHESLIAFSNSKYYDNSLLTFPSTDDLTNKVTLQMVKGLYERGGSRQNKKEAEAIVAEIKRRLEEDSGKSIGVITFSQPQQVAVEKRLETMLRNNPGLAQIASQMAEPIFVKNLENVQGDERDVILFSVGYGPDKQGRLPMNFGPVNQKGGWRRLNVAVSRARYEMKVFSSITPDSIRVDYNTPKGVVGLRDFIRYAGEGRSILEERTGETCEKDVWVEKLAQELCGQGHRVNTNVGSSDFHIDIAVLDPEKEGRYSYGIICDGSNYATAPSAVDREVVRPAVLESLGWKIERRWVMDEWNRS